MEELTGLEYGVITEGVVRSMFGLLGPALNKYLSSKPGLSKEEEDMATSSITLFNTPSHVDLTYGSIWKPAWPLKKVESW